MLKQHLEHGFHEKELIRICALAVALLLSWFGVWEYLAPFDFVAILATIIGGYPLFKEAYENIRERNITMELSAVVAILAALAIQQYFTSLIITFFVLILKCLEQFLVSGMRQRTGKLHGLPQTNTLRSKTPIQKTADNLAIALVCLALTGAVLTGLCTHHVESAIAAYIAAVGGAVAAGTRLSILTGISRLANEGIVVKEDIYLEQLAVVDTVILGKVGISTLDAGQAVAALRKLNCRVILLSEDTKSHVVAFARALGVNESYGDMLPAEKMERVSALMRTGRKIAMVGDGITDKAPLAEVLVGIAVTDGTAAGLENVGIISMNNNLLKIAEALKIGRQCMGVIYFNFSGAIILAICGVTLAFLEYITPLGAALIYVFAGLTFILNSARPFRS
jgi:cation transport ATPase